MPRMELTVVTSSAGCMDNLPLACHPTELPFFKKITEGHGVILGYKTLLELALRKNRNTGLLPGRQIYVLTHEPDKVTRFEDCIAVTSIDDIIKLTTRIKLFPSGGDSIYRQFINLPHVGAIHVAEIFVNHYGAKKFPELPPDRWLMCRKSAYHPAGNGNKHATRFTTYIPATTQHK